MPLCGFRSSSIWLCAGWACGLTGHGRGSGTAWVWRAEAPIVPAGSNKTGGRSFFQHTMKGTKENADIAQIFGGKGLSQEVFDRANKLRQKARGANVPEHVLGEEALDHIGEYEDDAVHVRDDMNQIDYEVIKVDKTFREAYYEEE